LRSDPSRTRHRDRKHCPHERGRGPQPVRCGRRRSLALRRRGAQRRIPRAKCDAEFRARGAGRRGCPRRSARRRELQGARRMLQRRAHQSHRSEPKGRMRMKTTTPLGCAP